MIQVPDPRSVITTSSDEPSVRGESEAIDRFFMPFQHNRRAGGVDDIPDKDLSEPASGHEPAVGCKATAYNRAFYHFKVAVR